ncbi:MAG: hypothetical protein IK079_02100, partial [Desulfovibrio sp.]|nr:hypothetical protein [Desulfovibrio sp.]
MAIIFHVDVNSAFLSWSALQRLRMKPDAVDLRTIPAAVCASRDRRHGIITAQSIAAREYGVKTGEPIYIALQKCPKLVLVLADFAFYKLASEQ